MGILTTILQKIETSMTAVTFAEAGEFEMARQYFQPEKNRRKRVLLGTDRIEISTGTLHYGLRLCKTIGGSLEIFQVIHLPEATPPDESAAPGMLQEALQKKLGEQGISYNLAVGKECLAEEMLKFTRNRRDLLCVIFDAMEAGSATCQQAKESMLARFHALQCPVVVCNQQTQA